MLNVQLDAMKNNQLTKGLERRVMYIENKQGFVDGARARIGWVEFSKFGCTVYYKGRSPCILMRGALY